MNPPKKLFYYFLLTLTLVLTYPIFFYKLGQSSLVSWDEAWYAAISKNINRTGNYFNLYFNNQRFADHPPAGFWLMAVSQKIFGYSEFSARFPSALLGWLSLIVIFLFGKLLASPSVGLASAIVLSASPWFVTRARSGNLDTPLTFFFLLTFYLAIKASKNQKYFIPFSLSLVFLFLTKTMVPLTILPSLIIIFWGVKTIKTKEFVFSLSLSLSLILSWFLLQFFTFPNFINKYLGIGLPQGQTPTSIWQNILHTKTYLHYSLGSLFRPLVLASPLSVFFINHKSLFAIICFLFSFLVPFSFSSRGQIWHLVPSHPFLILLGFSSLYLCLYSLFKKNKSLFSAILITISLAISVPQISRNWYEFIDIPRYISDEAILSFEAKKYPYDLIIDDRFLPAAVYYSDKHVRYPVSSEIAPVFASADPILLITRQWRLDRENIPPDAYQILKSDRDMILILTTSN